RACHQLLLQGGGVSASLLRSYSVIKMKNISSRNTLIRFLLHRGQVIRVRYKAPRPVIRTLPDNERWLPGRFQVATQERAVACPSEYFRDSPARTAYQKKPAPCPLHSYPMAKSATNLASGLHL